MIEIPAQRARRGDVVHLAGRRRRVVGVTRLDGRVYLDCEDGRIVFTHGFPLKVNREEAR